MAQRIDELSREKRVAQKVHETSHRDDSGNPRDYLEQVIGNLKWQQQKRSHEIAKGQMAQQLSAVEGAQGNREAQFEALSQYEAFHKKRAAQ